MRLGRMLMKQKGLETRVRGSSNDFLRDIQVGITLNENQVSQWRKYESIQKECLRCGVQG